MLLLLSSLLHITTGSVYSVTPDDHYYPNTTCHHCHNLQHYLLNTTKYFTSNTQLLFLPGLHHLHSDLILQNVHNISLITTPDTVIQCNSSVGIVMTNITNLIITNITVRSCLGNEYNNTTVLIKQCTNVQLRQVVIEESHNSYGIVGINILGDSHFSFIKNNVLDITYNDTTVYMKNHSLTIDHYHVNDKDRVFYQKIKLKFYQQTYMVRIQLLHSTFQGLKNDTAICIKFHNEGLRLSALLAKYCQFANGETSSVKIYLIISFHHKRQHSAPDSVLFYNCEFFTNQIMHSKFIGIIDIFEGPNVHISYCKFHHNKHCAAITKQTFFSLVKFSITISNTVFSSSSANLIHGFLNLQYAALKFNGPVIFHNISSITSVIRLHNSNILCSKYIEFANITGRNILEHSFSLQNYKFISILVKEGTVINVTHSQYETFASSKEQSILSKKHTYDYPSCGFQYLTAQSNEKDNYRNYSIIFDNNNETSKQLAYKDIPLTHCSWLPQSAFNTTMPLEVNKKYIKYINKSGTFDMLPQHDRQKTLCHCDINSQYDCNKELLGSV